MNLSPPLQIFVIFLHFSSAIPKSLEFLLRASYLEFQTDAPSSVLGCCMATVVLSQGLSLSLAHTGTTAHKTTYFRERMFLTLVVLKKSLKI